MELDFISARARLSREHKSISGLEIDAEWSSWFELYCHGFLEKLEALGFTNDANFEDLLTRMNQEKSVSDFLCDRKNQQAELAAFGLIVFDRMLRADARVSHFDLFSMHEDLIECFGFSTAEFIEEGIAIDRKNALAKAGSKGGTMKHKRHSWLRQWVHENVNDRMPKNRSAAKKLVEILPAHLADVSDDPERFILEVLREPKKDAPG